MTGAAAALSGIGQPRFSARAAGLWAGAAALILVAHVAVAYAVQSFSLADMSDGGPPPALAIEMSPLMTAPPVVEEALVPDAVKPDQVDPVDEPVAEEKPVTEPVEPPTVEKAEPVTEEPAEPDEPTVAALSEQPPPLDEVVPDIVETVAPDVVIPVPQPKPVETPAEPKVIKPVEGKAKKPVDKPKPKPKKERPAPAKTAMAASVDAKPAPRAAAPKSAEGAVRSGDSSKWNSKLRGWIIRHTRYPSAARSRRAEGTPSVTFTVDSSGKVVSARLARSSGDADLDRAALGALQGASVPAPPSELGARVTRTAPFVFSLRN